MPINLTLRNVKGSELTWDELDANFIAIKGPLDTILAGNQAANVDPYLVPVTKSGTHDFDYGKLVRKEALAFNATDLAKAKDISTSMSEIFSSWYRFSHGSAGTFPNTPTELTSWTYDAATDTLKSTVNSVSYLGFVSFDKYDTYRHEVVLGSANADDDIISIILAFVVATDGSEHTLSLVRSAGGMTPFCGIVYNFGQSSSWVVVQDNTVLVPNSAPNTGPGWFTSLVKVMCVRNGNDFAIATTELGDTTTYTKTLSITLSSDSRLQKFTGPQPYGYGAYSQKDSTFASIKFTPIIGSIYDVSNNQVWDLDINSGTYSINSAKSLADLGRGRLIYAPNLSELFYVSPSGSFEHISSAVVGPQGTQGIKGEKGDTGNLNLPGTTPGFIRKNADGTFSTQDTPYDITGFINGKPLASEVIIRSLAVRPFVIPANFSGSLSKCSTAPAATATFSILKNGAPFGYLTFTPGSLSGSFSATALVTFNVGDQIAVTGPSSADADLSDIVITFYGIQS